MCVFVCTHSVASVHSLCQWLGSIRARISTARNGTERPGTERNGPSRAKLTRLEPGRTIFRTTDGGAGWSPVAPPKGPAAAGSGPAALRAIFGRNAGDEASAAAAAAAAGLRRLFAAAAAAAGSLLLAAAAPRAC
jgi:hypothetical protein